ncbi:MAG: SIS domain-containing protein [Oscillospiraceae bacterium]|nr:SIS domain-containing protein [Oscillospiraceae bacterium]
MRKSDEYLEKVAQKIEQCRAASNKIEQFSIALADTIQAQKKFFAFGTGHSSLLAQELFYRAGGLVCVQPILESALMLHESASKSTQLERVAAYAHVIMRHYSLQKGDLLLICSNSGRNPLCVELAVLARQAGVKIAALTSVAHSLAGASRHESGLRLLECADIVLDNFGEIGDACVGFDGFSARTSPTSTVIGAAILQAAVAETVALLLRRGVAPEVFASSNIDGGDAKNAAFLERYSKEIRFL